MSGTAPASARILLINPNTSAGVTARLAEAGAAVAAAGTELLPLTAETGVPYIASRAEAQIGGAQLLASLAEHGDGADAAVVAAFGDPGLFAARELFDLPVVGMSEAAMLTACLLGRRFALVTFARALAPWYGECVAMHGMSERCAAIRTLGEDFGPVADVRDAKEAALAELANRAVVEDGADVVILAGAPLAGLADRLRGRVPVPAIDPVQAAVKQAEALLALRPRKPTAGSFRRPVPKPSRGLPASLARRIGGG